MALGHAKSNTIGDFTGTVTVLGSNGSTATAAATNLVRPVDWNSAHQFTQTISGNTAGQSTASGTNLVFAGTNGATVSLSTGAGAATLYVDAPAAGAAVNVSRYIPAHAHALHVVGQIGQASVYVEPVDLPGISFRHMLHKVQYTNTTNSSGSFTVSMHAGLYTRNGNTLSLLASASTSHATTNSGTAGNMSLWLGARIMNLGWSTSVPAGAYYVGILSRTTTGGAAGMTMSQWLASQITTLNSGYLGGASNASNHAILGRGTWSQSTTALPASMAFSDLRGASTAAFRPPIFWFDATTA